LAIPGRVNLPLHACFRADQAIECLDEAYSTARDNMNTSSSQTSHVLALR
jgi:hypothetical protein